MKLIYPKEELDVFKEVEKKLNNKCAKITVFAKLLLISGEVFEGFNSCACPQKECPRDEDDGYEKCKKICKQTAHAEVNAINAAINQDLDVVGSTLIVYKHTNICNDCHNYANNAGVGNVIIIKE